MINWADQLGFFMAVVNNSILLVNAYKGLGPDVAQELRSKLNAGWYLCAALALLLLMTFARPTYNRYRHCIIMLLRGARAVNLLCGLHAATPQGLYTMLGAKHDTGSATSKAAGVLKYQLWLLNLIFQGALNFPLPLKYLIWLQISVAGVKLSYLKKITCGAAVSKAFQEGATEICLVAQLAAYGVLGLLPSYNRNPSLGDPRLCEGLSALWLTQAYLDVIVILIAIPGCMYMLEFWVKKQFLESQGWRLQRGYREAPLMTSLSSITLVAVFLSALWVILEAVLLLGKPKLSC
jgi:hypothetical protein